MSLLMLISALQAQPSADEKRARELLGRVEHRYATARSLSYTVSLSEEGPGATGQGGKVQVLLRGRERLRLDLTYTAFGEEAHDVVVGRDIDITEYRSQLGEHRITRYDAGIRGFSMPDPAGACYLGGTLSVNVPLDLRGTIVDWKVEEADNAALIQVTVPGAVQDQVVITRLRLDPAASEIRGWSLEERGADGLVRGRTMSYADVRFDADVPDEKFAYTPPADSRKVETFSDAGAVRLQKHVGQALPDIELKLLDDSRVRLADRIRGSVTLICLWRSFHPDCTVSIHHFNVLHEKFGERGLKILLVSDESVEELQNYFRLADNPQPDWKDAFYATAADPGAPFNLSRHSPTTLLVDRKGVLRKAFLGVAKGTARYEPDVEALLEESGK